MKRKNVGIISEHELYEAIQSLRKEYHVESTLPFQYMVSNGSRSVEIVATNRRFQEFPSYVDGKTTWETGYVYDVAIIFPHNQKGKKLMKKILARFNGG